MVKKTPDQWFHEYGESHQNRTNKLIHWICVPLIVASIIGLTWDIPRPAVFHGNPLANWAVLAMTVALIFYWRLSVPLAIGMLGFYVVVIAAILGYQRLEIAPVWQASLAIFVVAWMGQFIGHKIEGKKPSFFQDLQFLMIGPVWLMGFIYRKLGIPY